MMHQDTPSTGAASRRLPKAGRAHRWPGGPAVGQVREAPMINASIQSRDMEKSSGVSEKSKDASPSARTPDKARRACQRKPSRRHNATAWCHPGIGANVSSTGRRQQAAAWARQSCGGGQNSRGNRGRAPDQNKRQICFALGGYTGCATTRGGGVQTIKNESMHTPQLQKGQGAGQAVQSGKAAGSRWIDALRKFVCVCVCVYRDFAR